MPDASPLDLLKQARVHNLLKEWARAKFRRLSAAEIAEIRELHPDFNPEPPCPAGGEPITAEPGEPAEVTAEQIARWETVYETKRRQLYRYVALGHANGDPCPLDEPAKMPTWWKKNMKQRVPAKVLAAAQRVAREIGTPVPAAPPEAVAAPPTPRDDSAYHFPLQVERLRHEQQRIQAQLDKARAGTMVGEERVVNQPDCESLLRQSLTLSTELRKAENDLTTWLATREELVSRQQVRGENAHIAGAIFSAVRRLVATVRPLLAGKTDAEQDALWKEKTLACFEALKDAKFNDHAAAIGTPE